MAGARSPPTSNRDGALKAPILPLVPGHQAREAASPDFPGHAYQSRQPDHSGDHALLESAVPQEMCQRNQLDPAHGHATLKTG